MVPTPVAIKYAPLTASSDNEEMTDILDVRMLISLHNISANKTFLPGQSIRRIIAFKLFDNSIPHIFSI